MRLRTVFVDGTFLAAVVDRHHPSHEPAVKCFDQLLAGYEAGTTVIRSHSGMVAHVPAEITKVLDVTPFRRWLRGEASQVIDRHDQLDLDRAAALVLVRRERIDEVATLESWWRDAGVTVLPSTADRDTSEPTQQQH